jgi:hypothetical protein
MKNAPDENADSSRGRESSATYAAIGQKIKYDRHFVAADRGEFRQAAGVAEEGMSNYIQR